MSLDTLATDHELADRLPGGIPTGSEERVTALLADASATVRKFTGQEFTAGERTLEIVKIRRGIARLSQRPVTAVSAVEDHNGNALTFTHLGDDRVEIAPQVFDAWSMEPYRNRLAEVRVTYSFGYDVIPDDVIAVVCNMVARALGKDPRDGGIMQESIEGYSYQLGSAGAAGAVGLLPDEERALSVYGRTVGAIRTGP